MTEILAWVKSALLFGIFSSIILMLSPDKSYEKHISLTVGMIFILLIIHPAMKYMNLDESTYVSYIRNYILSEGYGSQVTENEKTLYADSIRIQLETALIEAGYPVRNIRIFVGDDGGIYKLAVRFGDSVSELEYFENYIRNVFGDDVEVVYE